MRFQQNFQFDVPEVTELIRNCNLEQVSNPYRLLSLFIEMFKTVRLRPGKHSGTLRREFIAKETVRISLLGLMCLMVFVGSVILPVRSKLNYSRLGD